MSLSCQVKKEYGPQATYEKSVILGSVLSQLRVKDKRRLFNLMRTQSNVNEHTFLPQFGFTFGEFALWQILCENRKPSVSKSRENKKIQDSDTE